MKPTSIDTQGKAAIILSTDLAASLNSSARNGRLLTTAVGIRKIRASTREARDAVKSAAGTNKNRTTVSNMTFKVVGEDGNERRMTNREKKEAKLQAKSRKKRLLEEQSSGGDDSNSCHAPQQVIEEDSAENRRDDDDPIGAWSTNTQESIRQEELEDLQFDRKGFHAVPAVISSALAAQALRIGLLQVSPSHLIDSETSKPGECDDVIAKQWAIKIKQGMFRAEELRAKEDMRPMAYRIVPEVWSRLRPAEYEDTKETFLTTLNETESITAKESGDAIWSFTNMKPNANAENVSARTCPGGDINGLIVNRLWNMHNVHVSCGAKFGCDYLLYDGDRRERHAFAGLRVLRPMLSTKTDDVNCESFPIPCPYDIAGYVRGLNTAGKVALVATAIENADGHAKILFVDLALEKILSAPTHQKRRSKRNAESRKKVGTNLSKASHEQKGTKN